MLAQRNVMPHSSVPLQRFSGSDLGSHEPHAAWSRLEAALQGSTRDAEAPFACDRVEQYSPGLWNAATQGQDGSAWGGLPAVPSFSRIAGALTGLRVLVVEDDTDIRELLIAVLADAGAVVESAESAASGLDALRYFHPQLLVSDIGMPEEDGYSFIRRVRALGADDGGDIPSIALTAFTSDTDREKALGAGFTIHLSKPIDPIDLICALKNLAGSADS
jgi:CheY-like chemotaxis protein